MSLVAAAVLLLSACGVVAGLLVALATGDVRAGVPVMLELWTASGLLRLTADGSWRALATAAALVLLRKVLVAGLRPARVARKA